MKAGMTQVLWRGAWPLNVQIPGFLFFLGGGEVLSIQLSGQLVRHIAVCYVITPPYIEDRARVGNLYIILYTIPLYYEIGEYIGSLLYGVTSVLEASIGLASSSQHID